MSRVSPRLPDIERSPLFSVPFPSYDSDSDSDNEDEESAIRRVLGAKQQPVEPDSDSDDESDSSSLVYDVDYENLIDTLPSHLLSQSYHSLTPITSPSSSTTTVLLLSFSRSSPYLFLFLELNHPTLRSDPWNPCPSILRAVERGNSVHLIIETLLPSFDYPPFQTYYDWIEFVRQLLQGLSFLHEHSIVHAGLNDVAFMVDIGTGPLYTSSTSIASFDRSRLPVKYYFGSLAKAAEEQDGSVGMRKDVGAMMKRLESYQVRIPILSCFLSIDPDFQIPVLGPKLRALAKCMNGEEAREGFEEIVKTLPSDLIRAPLPPRPTSLLKSLTRRVVVAMRKEKEKEVVKEKDEGSAGATMGGGGGVFDASTLTLVSPTPIKMQMASLKELEGSSA